MFARWFTTFLTVATVIGVYELPRVRLSPETFRFAWSPTWTGITFGLLFACYANALGRTKPWVRWRSPADGWQRFLSCLGDAVVNLGIGATLFSLGIAAREARISGEWLALVERAADPADSRALTGTAALALGVSLILYALPLVLNRQTAGGVLTRTIIVAEDEPLSWPAAIGRTLLSAVLAVFTPFLLFWYRRPLPQLPQDSVFGTAAYDSPGDDELLPSETGILRGARSAGRTARGGGVPPAKVT